MCSYHGGNVPQLVYINVGIIAVNYGNELLFGNICRDECEHNE